VSLEDIIAHGTSMGKDRNNKIKCNDGFEMSVIANWGAYCSPRPSYCRDNDYGQKPPCGNCNDAGALGEVNCDFTGPYTRCEMGFPSVKPDPWILWAEFCEDESNPEGTVYPYVPVEMLRELVILHGGEVDAG
jgi:hypothetical protein